MNYISGNRAFYCLLIVGVLAASTVWVQAQHYPAGSEGIKCGSLPAPGFYVKDYNSFYVYDKVSIAGNSPAEGFTQFDYTQAPRLIWITDWGFLGANYGAAIRIPFVYQQFTHDVPQYPPGTGPGSGVFPAPSSYSRTTDNHFGLADIQIEPIILSWQLKHFDINTSYSFWVPTGDYNKLNYPFYNLGQGYWTHSFSFGITWYPDPDRTWAVSLLNHYDINTAQYSTLVNAAGGSVVSEDTTLGNIYTLEWAISKTIVKDVDVGVTGYYQQQVTDTENPGGFGPTYYDERIHVAGIGPEVCLTVPQWGLSASLRYAYEFSAMDHPEGHLINLSITKSIW